MPLIATVTLNPTIDIATAVDRIAPIRKLRCEGLQRDPGGGGINVARVIHRLGGDVVALYPAGGLVGELLHRLMDREGVKSLTSPISGETREDFTVFEAASRQQYRFVLPGPRLHGVEWMAVLKALANLPMRPAYVCASGSLPPGAPEDFYVRLGEIAAGFGARFVLDASGAPFKAALDAHLHLIKPNLRELQELAGDMATDEASIIAACRSLMERRRIDSVAVSLGAKGSLLVTRDEAWRSAPIDVEPVSAVGAGDSFLGGFLWAESAGKPPEEALRYAAAAGTAAVLAAGTELAHAEDVRSIAPRVHVEAVPRVRAPQAAAAPRPAVDPAQ